MLAERLAGLTTRGRCLLAAGVAVAVCAVALDERDLLRLGLFVAALPLLALVLATRTRRSVRASRWIGPDRLPVGTTATVTVTLSGGPLLGALRLTDTVPDAAGAVAAAPPRFTVHRMPARSDAQLHYPLHPPQRGVHRIGPLTGRATDPLGLAEVTRTLAEPTPLLVLPRIVDLHGHPPALGTGEGMPGAALAHQGQGRTDVLVRPYQRGDELRRVHWRSTARHDELMVRLEERPWSSGTTVLLDRRDAAHRGRGPGSSLELAVSLTASVCVHIAGRGDLLTLVTEDGTELGSTSGSIDPLLDTLAALRPSARGDLTGPTLSGDVLAVLGGVGTGQLDALLRRAPAGGHAVLFDVSGWGGDDHRRAPGLLAADAAAGALRRAGWRVVVARRGQEPERAWDALVAGVGP